MKKLCVILLVIIMVISLTACNDNSESIPTGGEEQSGVEEFTEFEQEVFDSLIFGIEERFNDPTSVKVLDIGIDSENTENGKIILKLDASNGSGGSESNYYHLWYQDLERGYSEEDLQESYNQTKEVMPPDVAKEFTYEDHLATQAKMRTRGLDDWGSYFYQFNGKNFEETPDLSVKKFNLALKGHWEELGLD